MHFDGKHAKLKWDDYKDKCANLQEIHGGTTQCVAVLRVAATAYSRELCKTCESKAIR